MNFIQMLINMKGSLLSFQVSDKLHNFKQIDVWVE